MSTTAPHLACPVCGKERQYRRVTHDPPHGARTVEEYYTCPDAHDFRHRPPDPPRDPTPEEIDAVTAKLGAGTWATFTARDTAVAEWIVGWNVDDDALADDDGGAVGE